MWVEDARATIEAQGRLGLLAAANALLLPCLASDQQWPEYSRLLSETETLLARSGVVDRDIAKCLIKAGDVAMTVGAELSARGAWKLARAQLQGLGEDLEGLSERTAQLR